MSDTSAEAFLKRPSYSKKSFEAEGLKPAEQIAIHAFAGAGKSSALRGLKTILLPQGFQFVSGGDFMRKLAAERDITLEQFQGEELTKQGSTHDRDCDTYLYTASQTYPKLVIEARISHCAAPNAFHVFFKCPFEVRAARSLDGLRKKFPGLTLEGAKEIIEKRDREDLDRLIKLYPDCIWPEEDFDSIVRTDINDEQEVVRIILEEYAAWREKTLKERI